MQLVVDVETGRLAQRVGLSTDVLQVVDVLEQASVPAHRVAQRAGERPAAGLVGQVERGLEQRHRLPVDHVPVARGRHPDRLEDLAVGDPPQRVAEGEPTGGRDRRGQVQGLGVERVGGPQRDGRAQGDVQGGRVPTLGRGVDDVVVHQGPEVEQLDRRRALHRQRRGRRRRASVSTMRARWRDPEDAVGDRASATDSSNVATTRWIRRSTSASRRASSATRRDVSRVGPA